jgi:hypothetical protein
MEASRVGGNIGFDALETPVLKKYRTLLCGKELDVLPHRGPRLKMLDIQRSWQKVVDIQQIYARTKFIDLF